MEIKLIDIKRIANNFILVFKNLEQTQKLFYLNTNITVTYIHTSYY